MENIFQRPSILMRLTMLTRDTISLLRAASQRTARETAHGLKGRKQRGSVEAGILPLNYSRPSAFLILTSVWESPALPIRLSSFGCLPLSARPNDKTDNADWVRMCAATAVPSRLIALNYILPHESGRRSNGARIVTIRARLWSDRRPPGSLPRSRQSVSKRFVVLAR